MRDVDRGCWGRGGVREGRCGGGGGKERVVVRRGHLVRRRECSEGGGAGGRRRREGEGRLRSLPRPRPRKEALRMHARLPALRPETDSSRRRSSRLVCPGLTRGEEVRGDKGRVSGREDSEEDEAATRDAFWAGFDRLPSRLRSDKVRGAAGAERRGRRKGREGARRCDPTRSPEPACGRTVMGHCVCSLVSRCSCGRWRGEHRQTHIVTERTGQTSGPSASQ